VQIAEVASVAHGRVSPSLALERLFPSLSGRLPRFPLTTLPTPVHALEALARAHGIGRLWIKRDDQTSSLYGGNKPRKLEFLIGDALRRRRRAVITFGGIGTHHGLATAVAAREAGLRTLLVLLPQPVTESVRRNLLLLHACGAELHYAPTVTRVALSGLRLCARGVLRGDVPYIIPTGGSSALGCVGYVNAACELAEQVRAGELPEPDAVFVPLGSGGTVAGLMLGLKLAGLRSRVVAVLVTDILPPSKRRLVRMARGGGRLLRRHGAGVPDVAVSEADINLVTGYLGRTYGASTEEGDRARRLAGELEGIDLDHTYTAKCLAATLALARKPAYRDRSLLFWNTYGSSTRLAPAESFHELPAAFHRFFEST
jgi:D-cysteine desulfhydrase